MRNASRALRATALLPIYGQRRSSGVFSDRSPEAQERDQHALNRPQERFLLLNIDISGNEHPDVTCDLIFPVIWNVATPATSHLIIDRLNRPDFLTTAGLRTVPRTALNYHPERGWGLTGGVWPDVAFMFAYSCSTHQPDVMVNIMRGTFRQYELDPTNQNTVPGQFSEWYHGESLVNNGMKLSPCSHRNLVDCRGRCVWRWPLPWVCNVNPNIPLRWKWVSLSNMPYHGSAVTYFACWVKGISNIFANYPFGSSLKTSRIELRRPMLRPLIHEQLEEIHLVALASPSHVVICVGNMAASSTSFTFSVSEIVETYITPGRYRIRVFHSEIDDWYDQGVRESSNIRGFTVRTRSGRFKPH